MNTAKNAKKVFVMVVVNMSMVLTKTNSMKIQMVNYVDGVLIKKPKPMKCDRCQRQCDAFDESEFIRLCYSQTKYNVCKECAGFVAKEMQELGITLEGLRHSVKEFQLRKILLN